MNWSGFERSILREIAKDEEKEIVAKKSQNVISSFFLFDIWQEGPPWRGLFFLTKAENWGPKNVKQNVTTPIF